MSIIFRYSCLSQVVKETMDLRLQVKVFAVFSMFASFTLADYLNPFDFECGKQPMEEANKQMELLGGESMLRRIVNGEAAYRGQYPWQAGLGYIPSANKTFNTWCGGTIIAPYWILTAAHCMFLGKKSKILEDPKRLLVSVGDHHEDDNHAHDEFHGVEFFTNHPLYDNMKGPKYGYDIALIKLKHPIKFNNYVQPACLATPGQHPQSSHCLISGWGTQQHKTSRLPNVLMGADVKIESRGDCEYYLRYDQYVPVLKKAQLDTMLCAGHYGEIDTCQGDSGGPLVCEEEGRFTVFGVTSWGNGCGKPDHPGVYTRVSHFWHGIVDHVFNRP